MYVKHLADMDVRVLSSMIEAAAKECISKDAWPGSAVWLDAQTGYPAIRTTFQYV